VENYKILVTGGTGYLGHEVLRALKKREVSFELLGKPQGFDLFWPFQIEERFLNRFGKKDDKILLFHLAAMSRYGLCQERPEDASRVNVESTGALAQCLRSMGGRMVFTSSDLVFDGEHAPYNEKAIPKPLSIYGETKVAGEEFLLEDPHNLVLRIPLLYGPSFDGKHGTSDHVIQELQAGRKVHLFSDEIRTPLLVSEAAEQLVELALDSSVRGVKHLPGPESLSRFDLGMRVAKEAGCDLSLIVQASRLEMPGPPRPKDCSLVSE
jgi:dTDP-4-dehydrorhamnose reductase